MKFFKYFLHKCLFCIYCQAEAFFNAIACVIIAITLLAIDNHTIYKMKYAGLEK